MKACIVVGGRENNDTFDVYRNTKRKKEKRKKRKIYPARWKERERSKNMWIKM